MWGRVLREVADARMLIKGSLLDEPAAREMIWTQLEQRDIARERVELMGRLQDPRDHLRLYGKIDIALDTYPYLGTTTLCEAILMGVPIVTRAGEQHVSRVGLSLLTHAGCAELVADSADEFVRIATALARDGSRRAQYHATLRERMLASAVCDGARFATDFAEAVAQAWRAR
jgi:predicted O-linked N-acetylglucosamine transferase (SPINDLY family)